VITGSDHSPNTSVDVQLMTKIVVVPGDTHMTVNTRPTRNATTIIIYKM